MTVAEYIFSSLTYGIEYEICKRAVEEAKEEKDIIGFCHGSVIRKCFLRCYRMFKPIEDMPETEKKELKEFVIKNFPGKGKAELMENCKIIYTSGMLSK